MGNTLGMKKTTKVMKIDGETLKLKTPVKAGDVMKDHPGLVLLESEAVKHYGTRAKPLEPHKELLPKRLYFLVELPKETKPRRVRSGIVMSAKDRLDNLLLTRRSASDLSILKQSTMVAAASAASEEQEENRGANVNVNVDVDGIKEKNNGGGVRLKMRLPRAEVEKLIQDCKDEAEAAKRIMSYYKAKANANGTSRERESSGEGEGEIEGNNNAEEKLVFDQLKGGRDRAVVKKSIKAPREKRVSFMPISEGGIQIAVAS